MCCSVYQQGDLREHPDTPGSSRTHTGLHMLPCRGGGLHNNPTHHRFQTSGLRTNEVSFDVKMAPLINS